MKELEIIKQVIDQAIKAGIFANLESTATVNQAWGYIKYLVMEKLKEDGRIDDSSNI